MAASDENSALFPIFILSTIALPLVPYTILKLFRAASKKTRNIHCECSDCFRSGKYRKSVTTQVCPSSVDRLNAMHLDTLEKDVIICPEF